MANNTEDYSSPEAFKPERYLDNDGQLINEEFDAVVVALGLDSELPHVPEIEGIIGWSRVKDEKSPTGYSIYHSRAYRRPEHYANKVCSALASSCGKTE